MRSRYPVLPSLITLGNAACGLVSIAISTTAQPQLGTMTAAFYAGILIYVGMLLDGLDGHVARFANQSSEFGAQLDSLCDAITFGVAPVFIMVNFSDPYYAVRILWGVGVLFSLCVILRLARFNVQTHEADAHDFFRGLPSPAAAGTLAAFAVAMPALLQLTDSSMPTFIQTVSQQSIDIIQMGLPALTLVLAGLMVSQIRYPHLLNQWLRRRRNFYRLAQLLFVTAAIVTIHELALPLMFCLFAFGYPLIALWSKSIAPVARRLPGPHR